MQNKYDRLKYCLLAIFAFNIIFSLLNNTLGSFWDLNGISGIKPSTGTKEDKKNAQKKEEDKSIKVETNFPKIMNFHYLKDINIDGYLNDWYKTFYYSNATFKEKQNRLWLQGAYNEENIYFSLILKNQKSLQGQMDDFSIYFDLKTRKTLRIEFNPADRLINLIKGKERQNIETIGGEFKIQILNSGGGFILELSIPLKSLYIKSSAGFNFDFAIALMNTGRKISNINKSKFNKTNKIIFLKNPPKTKNKIIIDNNIYDYKLKKGVPQLIHDSKVSQYLSHYKTLKSQKKSIFVDGEIEDWDLDQGYLIAKDIKEYKKDSIWLHSVHDAQNIYFLVQINDLTPLLSSNRLDLKFNNANKIKTLTFIKKQNTEIILQINGNSILNKGAKLKYKFDKTGTKLHLECSIPKKLLINESKQYSFTLNYINDHYQFKEFLKSRKSQHGISNWGKFILAEKAQKNKQLISIIDNKVLDYKINKNLEIEVLNVPPSHAKKVIAKQLTSKLTDKAPTIDGDLSDWTFADIKFVSSFNLIHYNSNSLFISSMYDQKNLYFYLQVNDPSPLKRKEDEPAMDNDYIELRFQLHGHQCRILNWYDPILKGKYNVLLGQYGRHVLKKVNSGVNIKSAYKVLSDNSYALELAIPLNLISPKTQINNNLKDLRFSIEFATTFSSYQLGFINGNALNPSVRMNPAKWGHLYFTESENKLELETISGEIIPVSTENKKFIVDWSQQNE